MNDERPTNGMDDGNDEAMLRATLEPWDAALRSDAVWADPPRDLADSIAGAIESARVGPRPEPAAGREARTRSRVRPLLVAAAVAAAFGVGLVVAGGDEDNDQIAAVAEIELTGTDLAPEARARGDVVDRGAGFAIRLTMAGLPPADEGEYYEGWLRADDGEMVSVGTFHMRNGDGPIVLWSGVHFAEYDTLVVTEQTERAGQVASDRVMLEGPVEPRSG